jgi:hypothetical protein
LSAWAFWLEPASLAVAEHTRALRPGIFDLRLDIPQLAFMDQRANLDLRIHAVAHSQFLGLAHTGLEKWLIQAAVHVASLDRKTSLPGIDECAPDRASRGDFYVGIGVSAHNAAGRMETVAFSDVDSARAARGAWDGQVLEGEAGIRELILTSEPDLVLNGIVGAAGLAPTIVALGEGIDVALANKESLVIGGELTMALAEEKTLIRAIGLGWRAPGH